MMIMARRVAAAQPAARSVEIVPHERATLHDGQQLGRVLQDGDVGQRVAVDDEQVGQVALPHRSELVGPAHELGAVPRGPADDVERRDPCLLDVELELVGVAAVGQADGAVVVAAQELHPGLVGPGQYGERLLDVLGHRGREAEAATAHQLGEADGEELARHEEGAELDHALDGHGVHSVAVVDDVDAGIERHVDGLAVGDVAAHQHAALVRRLDPRRDLLRSHFGLLARGDRAVPARDEHLDDLGALLDLLAHGEPEAVGTVGTVDGAAGAHVPVPREALVTGVARRADVTAARHQSGAGEHTLGDGRLHGRVDGEGCPCADRPGEPAPQQQFEVMGRPHGLQRRRLFEPEGGRLGAELVIGGVEVAAHHARHHRAPTQIHDPVVRTGLHGRAGPHHGDAAVLDHHGGAGAGTVGIKDGGVAQDQPGHGDQISRAPIPFTHTEGTIVTRSRSAQWAVVRGPSSPA